MYDMTVGFLEPTFYATTLTNKGSCLGQPTSALPTRSVLLPNLLQAKGKVIPCPLTIVEQM